MFSLGATEVGEKHSEPEGDRQEWCQSQTQFQCSLGELQPMGSLSRYINMWVPYA